MLRQNETANDRLSNFSQLIKTTMTSWCLKINATSFKITNICQTGYTNHDRHKLKIGHDVTDKPVKPVILNVVHTKVYEIPEHFIHEIKTKGYDVIGVNVFHTKVN